MYPAPSRAVTINAHIIMVLFIVELTLVHYVIRHNALI